MHEAAMGYLVIARAGNQALEREIDGLMGPDRTDLSASRRDLVDAAMTERTFDRQLREIVFPYGLGAISQRLYATNQSRAALTVNAAHSRTVSQLRGFERRLAAANAQVEAQVRQLRAGLHLPPPPSS